MLVVILLVHQLKLLSYKCVQKKGMLISDSLGQTKKKCGGGGGETTIEMRCWCCLEGR